VANKRLERPASSERGSMLLQHIPLIVRNNFKAACARRGHSMIKVLRKFMKTYAESNGKEPKMPWTSEDY